MTGRLNVPIQAGLVDAGFSSLATFAVGLFAVRVFDPELLGVYALAFSAYLLATIPPRFLLLLPAEVAAVELDRPLRFMVFRESVILAIPTVLVSGAAVSLWLLVAPTDAPGSVLRALTVTAVAASIVSPIQDHLRQLLHIAGASWTAAAVSAIHFAAALSGLYGAWLAGVPPEWVPLGAFGFAFLVSGVLGSVGLAVHSGDRPKRKLLDRRDLLRSGLWLLPVGILPSAANFVAAALVAHFAGAGALGFAEAARVVGRPVTVLSIGLLAVLGPHSMRAGGDADVGSARKVSTRFATLVGAFGIGYLLLAGVEYPANPIPDLLPNAYIIPGLLLLTIVANITNSFALPFRAELMGGRRERELTKAEALGAAAQTAVAASASATASYAIPVGALAAALMRVVAYLPSLRRLYERKRAKPEPDCDGKRRVLVSAFFCQPRAGSEAGVGWSTASEMARHYRVWVLTQGRNREAIEAAMLDDPTPDLHFEYFDLPRWVSWANRDGYGLRLGLQAYHYLWQMAARSTAKRLHREHEFDIGHHVTVVKYWTPSLLSWLGLPFLWGPVGGGESAPRALWRTLGIRGAAYEVIRNTARWIGERDPAVRYTAKRCSIAVATTEETAIRLRKMDTREVVVFSAVGLDQDETRLLSAFDEPRSRALRLLCVGKLIAWKGFDLAVQALAEAGISDCKLWIIGDGPDRPRLEALASELGVAESVIFLGRLPRDETLAHYGKCDVLMHPSLHDSGGFVCAEAMAAGLPVVCLDLGGPAEQVTRAAGIRVEAGPRHETVRDLAAALLLLAANPELRLSMGAAAKERATSAYVWSAKGLVLAGLYERVLDEHAEAKRMEHWVPGIQTQYTDTT